MVTRREGAARWGNKNQQNMSGGTGATFSTDINIDINIRDSGILCKRLHT